jgi:hypothetical protein
VDVTGPDVPVLKPPKLGFDNVNVAVTVELSMSLTTMSIRFSDVSSVYVSAADKFDAVGASFTAVTVIETVAVSQSGSGELFVKPLSQAV